MEINPAFEKYLTQLTYFEQNIPEISKKMVMAGAKPVADAIRGNLNNLPSDDFRKITENDMFRGVPNDERNDLLNGLGIAPVDVNNNGDTNTKVGFDGYGRHISKKYPKGVPNALLARAIESGSSVRKKTPFVRTAVNKTKQKAIDEMEKTLVEEIKVYAL